MKETSSPSSPFLALFHEQHLKCRWLMTDDWLGRLFLRDHMASAIDPWVYAYMRALLCIVPATKAPSAPCLIKHKDTVLPREGIMLHALLSCTCVFQNWHCLSEPPPVCDEVAKSVSQLERARLIEKQRRRSTCAFIKCAKRDRKKTDASHKQQAAHTGLTVQENSRKIH